MRKAMVVAVFLALSTLGVADPVSISYVASLSLEVAIQAGEPFTVGDQVFLAYFVTNEGEVTLSDVKVVDSVLGEIPLDKTVLAPGESTEGVAAYVVTEADVCSGISTTATATAIDPCGVEISTSVEVSIEVEYDVGLKITKEVNKLEVLPGEPIIYTYTVENVGNVTLTDVVVTDSLLGNVPLNPEGTPITLAPGETATGSLTYTPSEDEICTTITNKAFATAVDPCGREVSVETEGELSVKVISPPAAITLQCFTDKTEAMVGEQVMYTYILINSGQVPLRNIALVDTLIGEIELPKTELAPGEEMKVEVFYTVTEADVCADLVNVANVTAVAPCETVSAECTTVVKPLYRAILSLTKVADKEAVRVGDEVTYTYTVTNEGNVTLTDVAIVDAALGPVPFDNGDLAVKLAPGESATAHMTYTVTEDDICAPIANKATATALDPCGNEVVAEATLELDVTYTARLELEVWPDKTQAHLGDTVIFNYKVRNAGDVTLTDVVVIDERLGEVLTVASLAPYEWAVGTAPYQVTEADLCQVLEIKAEATANDICGNPVGPVPAFQAPIARLAVEKATEFEGPANVGDVITYTFTVTNVGGTPLKDIKGVDSLLGGEFVVEAELLMPGEVATGEATYTVTALDATGLPIVNVHTVTAVDLWGNPVGPVKVTCSVPTVISSLLKEWSVKGHHLAMFQNNTGQTVKGFRILFDRPVTEVKQLAFGGMAPIVGELNEEGMEATFMGEIAPNATLLVEWLPEDAQVVALVWILEE